jgi:hypothetical protein
MHSMKNRLQAGFKRPRLDLVQRSTCKGRAVVTGVLYELVCADCSGSGWVFDGARLMLPLDELITQLSFKLQQAQRKIEKLTRPAKISNPEQQY